MSTYASNPRKDSDTRRIDNRNQATRTRDGATAERSHPDGRCDGCGQRVFGTASGGPSCFNDRCAIDRRAPREGGR